MVKHALSILPHEYIELEPGDALFFHSNLLHRSEANLSDSPRWSIISCYNSLTNPAFNDNTVSRKQPIITVPDDALLFSDAGAAKNSGDFLRKENDPALQDTGWEQQVKTNE